MKCEPQASVAQPGNAWVHSPTGMDADWASILDHHIVGTYNVFTAARDAGVRRGVFSSTGAVGLGYDCEEPWLSLASGDAARLPESGPILTWDAEPKPHRLDAVSKLFGTEVIEPIPIQRGRTTTVGSIRGVNTPLGSRPIISCHGET